ncbi:MAG: hypothetical protein J0H17_18760 [Rhizobiales bacterium]|nr:hypothetical protein [Hyphomicrobiales bacterium]
MKLSDVKINAARVEAGAWVKDIPEMGDLELKVRGFQNADDRAILAREMEALPAKSRMRGRVSDEDRERIMTIRLRDAILVDWRNIEGEDGKPVPFSKDAAEKLLTDPDLAAFRGAVVWAAGVVAQESDETTEDITKN